ncbi:MAG: PilZ domain-containing protein [bacterium]
MPQDDQRKHLRYSSDKNSILRVAQGEIEQSEVVIGLLRDVSKGGCAGVFHNDYFDFSIGKQIVITSDEFEQTTASIVWSKNLDERFLKVGFEFASDD